MSLLILYFNHVSICRHTLFVNDQRSSTTSAPFVDDEAVGYVPEYADTVKRLQGEEDDAHDTSPKKLITYIEERITQMSVLPRRRRKKLKKSKETSSD
ncbi:hypothetical protein Tco_1087773 [Tanacetum coccineum]